MSNRLIRIVCGNIVHRVLVIVAWGISALALGQSQKAPEFDVTSVKPIEIIPGRGRSSEFSCSNGRLLSTGYPPRYLIMWAWNIEFEGFRLFGLPTWAVDARDEIWAVEGRVSQPVSQNECRLMLRALLRDRFKLAVHLEKRPVDAYALSVGNKGSKMLEVTDPKAPPNGPGFVVNGRPNQVFDSALQGWTMPQLAYALFMARLGRPIVDRTGLNGIYKIALTFQVRDSPNESGGPDVTTALNDQLGLRLVPSKEVIDAVVVDHLERPNAN